MTVTRWREADRSHIIVERAQLNVLLYINSIFIMKSQIEQSINNVEIMGTKSSIFQKNKDAPGGPKMLRRSIFFSKIGS